MDIRRSKMKKILLLLLLPLSLLLGGCGAQEDKSLDLTKVKENISQIALADNFTFTEEKNINNLEVLDVYGVDANLLGDYLFYIPSEVVNPSMYLIAKPKEDDRAILKYQIEDMLKKYYNSYYSYYPKEAKMIEDRLAKEEAGYLIYIVSSDNNKVYEAITKSFK